MRKFRLGFIVLWMLICSATLAIADVNIGIGIGLPNVSIGINLPLFPELVPVPGYPVYYAPRVSGNYFFYDGMYWVFENDNWYASSWYDGPWSFVQPSTVPLFILRVPVRYYRQPPVYFRGWHANAPPRWGQHWGRGWEQRRKGWDRWNRNSAPARAPLPVYQRKYSGERYPRVEQQRTLHSRSYRYQPRDTAVRKHYNRQVKHQAPAAPHRGTRPEPATRKQEDRRSMPYERGPAPHDQKQRPIGNREQQPQREHQREQREQREHQGARSNGQEGRNQQDQRNEERGHGRN